MEYTTQEIEDLWYDFLSRTDYGTKLLELLDKYPAERSLFVSYTDISDYNDKFAHDFLENPQVSMEGGQKAIKRYLQDEAIEINLRVNNIPDYLWKEVRELRSVHLHKFVSIYGIVRRATEIRPRLKTAVFECSDCHNKNYVEQDGIKLKEPDKCEYCGKPRGKVRFILIPYESTFIDTQSVEIQDLPEKMRGGEQPQRLMAHLEDDLAGKIVPGDRVVLNGILRARERKVIGMKTTVFQIYLDVTSIDLLPEEVVESEPTEEEKKEIIKLSQKPDIIEQMRDSIAPSIYGMNVIKEALVLQMFGGVAKQMKDGTKIRGDIHILLVGDPGTAKSQLLQYMAQLVPRGLYTSGKGSSAAGLTATAVRDEAGRWTLEAGALVIADLGLAAIDEIDKMSPTDRDSIYQAMEQQIVTVTKAGIYATLSSRCAILAAANPKYGRFDPQKPWTAQIDLPSPLLSRFDVIFKIVDVPNPEYDKKMADYILNVHLAGEKIMRDEENDYIVEQYKPKMDIELLRKYVRYAKKEIIPKLSDEAMRMIEEEYLNTRKKYEETRSVPITPRQLEAMIRLAEASARARLSEIVTKEDAERAIKIVRYFLKESASEEGIEDMDIIYTGASSKKRQKWIIVDDIIRQLEEEKGYAKIEDIVPMASDKNIGKQEVEEILNTLRRNGQIYSPREGVYKHAVQ